ncbi:glycoside hydrolase family 47 protein [Hortaea werneckii]|nr:glycoside hydrolase family 47 protein [Hortaea werneckii]
MHHPLQPSRRAPWPPLLIPLLTLLLLLPLPVHPLDPTTLTTLRDDTRALFYHGYDSYLLHAFPEDELRPISCRPQTRNRENPADIGLNDVLGNYSVTLVDSLSTLAILASDEEPVHARRAWAEFQSGVRRLVELYGDGKVREDEEEGSGESGRRRNCGTRACGFDLDSKVQVFETNIRGVGGLLSAHLFASGELPIRGYEPVDGVDGEEVIEWDDGWKYDGQLLRLAHDLASRLLPAFSTATGLPYPRVNLRHGSPFYQDAEAGVCRLDGTSTDPREITENCAAGAGSLVLEFTTLSRLTGDYRFERLAKKAFWAVWERRSSIGLLGNGIDSESGQWTIPALSGIGAGIDSFYEYAMKGSILLSGLPPLPSENTSTTSNTTTHIQKILDAHPNNPEDFLRVWDTVHASITRHILRSSPPEKHPYYAQSDLLTGAPRYAWIDNLSAYYPGLLTLSGHLSEAIQSHLLFAALWTRYASLPERWQPHSGGTIDPSFRHWAGRPEFIESTYYLYQATRDPWFLHVGEMTLKDIWRRCWTPCGWADLGDVVSGEKRDRMESFFLGETAKYLYLLFDERHPLNVGPARGGSAEMPVVFSTEGHPLVVPRGKKSRWRKGGRGDGVSIQSEDSATASPSSQTTSPSTAPSPAGPQPTCPLPPPLFPLLTGSSIPTRPDFFHAAALANLHNIPFDAATNPAHTSPSLLRPLSPSNYTYYPWTLPSHLIPMDGVSAVIRQPLVSTLTFPNLNPEKSGGGKSGKGGGAAGNWLEEKGFLVSSPPLGALQKVWDGVLVHSLSNLRLNLVQEVRRVGGSGGGGGGSGQGGGWDGNGGLGGGELQQEFRVSGVGNLPLGRDEKVLVSGRALDGVSPVDPHFRRVRDLEMVDLVVDVPVLVPAPGNVENGGALEGEASEEAQEEQDEVVVEAEVQPDDPENGAMESFWKEVESLLSGFLPSHLLSPHHSAPSAHNDDHNPAPFSRTLIPAILPTGLGAAPLPPSIDSSSSSDDLLDPAALPLGDLPFQSIFYLDSTLCPPTRLPLSIAKHFSILVLRRGECSFSDKLAAIPSFPPSSQALQLVVVLSFDSAEASSLPPPPGSGSGSGPATHHQHQQGDGEGDGEGRLIRPLLDTPQRSPAGFERRYPIAMVMVDASSDDVVEVFRRAAVGRGGFDEEGVFWEEERNGERQGGAQGSGVGGGAGDGGLAVKRRYWFESLGVPIGNLIML